MKESVSTFRQKPARESTLQDSASSGQVKEQMAGHLQVKGLLDLTGYQVHPEFAVACIEPPLGPHPSKTLVQHLGRLLALSLRRPRRHHEGILTLHFALAALAATFEVEAPKSPLAFASPPVQTSQ
eukprot:Skav201087  [mRNA]  locus=scaffold2577:37704:41099:+ [translate_table: standard]